MTLLFLICITSLFLEVCCKHNEGYWFINITQPDEIVQRKQLLFLYECLLLYTHFCYKNLMFLLEMPKDDINSSYYQTWNKKMIWTDVILLKIPTKMLWIILSHKMRPFIGNLWKGRGISGMYNMLWYTDDNWCGISTRSAYEKNPPRLVGYRKLMDTILVFNFGGTNLSLLLTDFVSLYTYEFCLSLWKIAWSSVILLLPLFMVPIKNYLPLII